MPLQISSKEFDTIIHVVARFPDGAAMKDLIQVSELKFPKRTLQRRLEHLVAEGRLIKSGHGSALRYRLATVTPIEKKIISEPSEASEWISLEAVEIRTVIRHPVARRTPVGYQGAFLDEYQPNKTFYLPPDLRRELVEMGQVGLSNLPAGTYFRQVMDRLLIDLSWNSSRLEGNTYSLLETQRLLALGENAKGKAAEETQMILNHKAAIEMLADQAEEIGFNRYTICNLHALLSDNLLADPGAGGRVRSRPVGIGGSVYHPLEVPQQIDERFDQILFMADSIEDPFEQAFFAMVHLPYLQPFEDVNKRVSRLAANIPLIRQNVCPLSFIDVEQDDYMGGLLGVYELNRIEYLRDVFAWAYRRSCVRYAAIRQSLGDPDPFRLQHRALIGRFVREVVQNRMDKQTASHWIAEETIKAIPETNRNQFIRVVEIELESLHSGNIARYRLRPSEFESWKVAWKS